MLVQAFEGTKFPSGETLERFKLGSSSVDMTVRSLPTAGWSPYKAQRKGTGLIAKIHTTSSLVNSDVDRDGALLHQGDVHCPVYFFCSTKLCVITVSGITAVCIAD